MAMTDQPNDLTQSSDTPSAIAPSPSSIAATAPASVQSFGQLGYVAPTYANAATVDPNSSAQYLAQYEQATQNALNPTFQQQQLQLQEANAARGISNTGAAGYLQGNLQGQQGATLSAAYSPLINAAMGYNQQDVAQNAAQQQAANLQNATAATDTSALNAGTYNTALNTNAQDYNQYLSSLQTAGEQEQQALLSAYLNSFGSATGVQSILGTGLNNEANAYSSIYGDQTGEMDAMLGGAGAAMGGGAGK